MAYKNQMEKAYTLNLKDNTFSTTKALFLKYISKVQAQ